MKIIHYRFDRSCIYTLKKRELGKGFRVSQETLVLPFMKVKVDNARVRYDGILRYGSLQPYSKNRFLFYFCELRHQVGFTLLLIRNIITIFCLNLMLKTLPRKIGSLTWPSPKSTDCLENKRKLVYLRNN